tara:strand:+ start:1377 stop:4379 length:3003 start_codon:yes stop_codon:yes gene_type:complete
MAYTKRWSSTIYSYNENIYTVEIWDDNYSGASVDFVMGAAGPEITYSSTSDDKFEGIITSKLTVPFMVEDAAGATFFDNLRNSATYEEKDVYIHLYISGETRPLWSGFVLMDLSNNSNKSFPYEEELTAIDGLALLKELDYIDDNTLIPPYTLAAAMDSGLYTNENFNEWIKILLEKAGAGPGVDTGVSSYHRFSTSVNWYYEDMAGVTAAYDPLQLTFCKAGPMFEMQPSGTTFNSKSCYEFLEAICKVWGMRCIYWQHTYFFVQIGSYKELESGTLAAPINITSRIYDHEGTSVSNNDYLGYTNYSRYEQDIYNKTNPGVGIQMLSGTTLDNYSRLKQVVLDFKTMQGGNYFTGFPLLEDPATGYPSTGGLGTNVDYFNSESLGTFTDAANFGGFSLNVDSTFTKYLYNNVLLQFNISCRARLSGTSPWTHMVNSSNSWIAYSAPTSASIPAAQLAWFFDHEFFNSQGQVHTINVLNKTLGTHADFVGDWEFEIFTYTFSQDIGAGDWTVIGHGSVLRQACCPPFPDYDDPSGIISYTNGIGQNSSFTIIYNGNIGTDYEKTYMRSGNVSDSLTMNVANLYWGDTDTPGVAASLIVSDSAGGSTYTDYDGKWGLGTLSGTSQFTTLLGSEMLNCSDTDCLKVFASFAVSENGKTQTDGSGTKPVFLNPIGKLNDDGNSRMYVFNQGTFNLQRDEASGEWFEQTYTTVASSASTQLLNGPFSGPVSAPTTGRVTTAGLLVAPIGQNENNIPTIITSTTAAYNTSPITSIAIPAIGTALFKIDDVLEIYDFNSKTSHEITLSADQGASDETLSIDSLVFDSPIPTNSPIRLSPVDCSVQYQRKSKGTVGGLPVTATTLGPLNSDGTIDGVDTTYIKLVPSDFMANTGGGATKTLQFNDSGTTGVKPGNSGTILWAFVSIPYGKKATAITVWGNGTKTVNVYDMELDGSGLGSIISTGSMDTAFDIDPNIEATDSNMLAVSVGTDATANRVHGGRIIITDI